LKITAFHIEISDINRPAGANLFKGSLGEISSFLDTLQNTGSSAAGIEDAHDGWRN
jgi:hypothetical protein